MTAVPPCTEQLGINVPAVVEVLLAAGSDIMARSEDGRTPLHETFRNPAGDRDDCSRRRGRGSEDDEGDTPLAVAAERLTLYVNLKPLEGPSESEEEDNARVMVTLLEAGADPDAVTHSL